MMLWDIDLYRRGQQDNLISRDMSLIDYCFASTKYTCLYFIMQAIAEESHSESKWKQLGELAMSAGKVIVCL